MSTHQHNKPNRLLQESSPYLQQHAYNPVDWHPWGEEALTLARQQNKPILVSIGYSTCHWCHVMERESFEDEQVAAFMNENFINIKVDREERPDIDALYMEAVMLIQDGQGGWPLNCFLTEEGKPFFGGTYFPPQPAHRRPSWSQVLQNLSKAYKDQREDIEKQASQILHYIELSENQFVSKLDLDLNTAEIFDQKYLETTFENLRHNFDEDDGGFGNAPKFPGTMGLRFCLNYHLAQNEDESPAAKHLHYSLQKMIRGGIYDQLGGGFSRYTVDGAWLVPHFEKMLYDNALLVGLLADSFKLSQKPLYKKTIVQTLDWVSREMTSDEGLFYSALDADSEGVEGKFYVWDKSEIDLILGNFSPVFCAFYGVTEQGNWEHKNILNRPISLEQFAQTHQMNAIQLEKELALACQKLLKARNPRIRPGLDDKILVDWNALLITAYCKAYQALQIEAYRTVALHALDTLIRKVKVDKDTLHLYHTYKEGKAKNHAFLDDYAFLIEALLAADAIVPHSCYLESAQMYTDLVLNEFLDHKDHLFFFTSAKQQDIILHKKSWYDNATPSGNSTMVHNLQQLAILLNEQKYQQHAQKTLLAVRESVQKYPSSFSRFANAIFAEVYPLRTMTVRGKETDKIQQQLQQKLLFNTTIRIEEADEESIIVCKDQTCHLPVQTIEEALALL